MTPTWKKKLEPVWWIGGVVLAIATMGYVSSEKVNELMTKTAAHVIHTAQNQLLVDHSAQAELKLNVLASRIDQAEQEAHVAQIRDVRIEAQQRNVDDRLQILLELNRVARTVRARRAQSVRIEELERDIEVRELAIKRSLGPTDHAGHRHDPMEGLDGL